MKVTALTRAFLARGRRRVRLPEAVLWFAGAAVATFLAVELACLLFGLRVCG